ncbi:MAG TPA: heparan-alpha-glucosaminide N-acetyltransferase domain-containing protein [Polyangiales bacterium]|nr:heparan-alpha-glucosaminide N-acetyltransferase domain-containing protein [Polyangiales bacterium]
MRLQSIDMLRGLVIVWMVLDHTRDFFTRVRFEPTDLAHTTPALFMTRFITHFCAPVFIMLAGTSAYLASARLSRPQLARFLLTRGLWLIVVEFTLVNFAWNFNFAYKLGLIMQVIWAIGASMCVLAGLVFLPLPLIAALSLLLIGLHNLLDPIHASALGDWASLWRVLHEQGPITTGLVLYPLVPWIGVMAGGFALGPLFSLPAPQRRRALLAMGAAACLLFVVLRAPNLYGDPAPWSVQRDATFSLLSFLNVTKYPPSLLYLLVTLGPALLALAWFEGMQGRVVALLATFGRVPLFAYVVHLTLVHALAGLFGFASGFGSAILRNLFVFYPTGYGTGLAGVYTAYAIVLLLLYPACRWFAGVKRRHSAAWLAYL